MVAVTPKVMDLRSVALLLALAFVWAGSFFTAEFALRELPPLTIAFFRCALAVPILAAAVAVRGLPVPWSPSAWGGFAVMGLLNTAVPFSLIFWGQTRIESGLASVINTNTALLGALMAGLLLKDEPLTAGKVGGAALGGLGVAIIMGPSLGWEAAGLGAADPAGLAKLALLGACLSYALAGVWGRLRLGGRDPLVNALGMVICGALILLPLVLLVDGVPHLELSRSVWLALGFLAVCSTAIAYVLYFALLGRAGAANALLVTLLIPPMAIAMGAVFLGEALTPSAWIGFAVIAFGLTVTDGRLYAGRRGTAAAR